MATATTKFTKKQAGVIYRNMKLGKIEIDKATVSKMYDCVNDGWGIDWNGSENRKINLLVIAVDAIFDDNFKLAQRNLDEFAAA